ncbi:cellobiohydrolaseI, partial [Aureobasidium melanogenum]
MISASTLAALLALGHGVLGQQAGTSTAENHPPMSYQKCTTGGQCTTVNTNIVLDANWRWLHSTNGYTNCYTGNKFDSTLCPNNVQCAANCALDGADYSGTYGIQASGNSVSLKLKQGNNVGSRVYLINGNKYELFKLKNQEFTFDVDVSGLGCGINGALYFVKMDADGGLAKYPTNKAGAPYGTGYCDAQCPRDLKFIAGKANVEGWVPSNGDPNSGTGNTGSCCAEMDIWEANSISTALTPHPCTTNGPCTGNTTCGTGESRYDGYCDKDGCDFNPYRWGAQNFFGPGKTVDSKSKMTVVTQFVTNDNTATGTLTAIRRLYVQNGKVIQQANTNVAGITQTNQITDSFCKQQKAVTGDPDSFSQKGGLAGFSKDLDAGMALVFSVWDDYDANMLWLDSTYPVGSNKVGAARGTCPTTSGKPSDVESQQGNAAVTFSNVKFGPIGSTYKAQ